MKKEEPDITIGKIKGVERIEDLPKAILDAMLEGLTAAPQDFAILGMGFLVGYEGMDIMAFLTKPLAGIADNFVKAVSGVAQLGGTFSSLDLVYPMGSLPVQMGGIAQDISKLVGGPVIFPDKHITQASKNPSALGPGVSYYGPPPAGVDPKDWPPYGITLQKLEDSKKAAPDADKWKYELEQILSEQKIKILMGCMGAITAYTLTRPGVMPAIAGALGNVVSGALQGAGAAVPF